MREDFEPTFGVEIAGGPQGQGGFRAKKSKNKIMPDPKTQIYSLADLMNSHPPEQLQIP
jgi:hypothetical protein